MLNKLKALGFLRYILFIFILIFTLHFTSYPSRSKPFENNYHLEETVSVPDDNIQLTEPENKVELENYYFYEPFPFEPGNQLLQIGGSFTLLPIPVVENEIPAPALDVQYKRGIFKNISFVGSFSTNYFTNLLHAGMQYNNNIDRFSFGLANHIGIFAGFISYEGQFDDNTAFASYYLPIARIGYRFDKYSVSMSWAFAYIFIGESKVSDVKALGIKETWNDFFCTLALEQPFLKESLLSLGFSMTFSRTPYQAWLLYNTIDQYLFVPEFFFGFQL